MLTISYNTETKEVTQVSDLPTFRLIALHMAQGLGGPGFTQHLLEGVLNAADNTSNDSDYRDQIDGFFDHVKEEHVTEEGQRELVNILRDMALAIPRRSILAEHYRQMGTSEPESFNA